MGEKYPDRYVQRAGEYGICLDRPVGFDRLSGEYVTLGSVMAWAPDGSGKNDLLERDK